MIFNKFLQFSSWVSGLNLFIHVYFKLKNMFFLNMLSVDWVWLKWNEIPDENKILHVFKIYVFNMLFHFVYIFIIYGWLSPLVLSYQVFRSTCLLGLLCCNIKECLYNFFFGGWGAMFFSVATFYRKNIWTERCNK